METELWKQSYRLAKQPFCYGSHHFWVMSYGNWELSCWNTLSKQALSHHCYVSGLRSIQIFLIWHIIIWNISRVRLWQHLITLLVWIKFSVFMRYLDSRKIYNREFEVSYIYIYIYYFVEKTTFFHSKLYITSRKPARCAW